MWAIEKGNRVGEKSLRSVERAFGWPMNSLVDYIAGDAEQLTVIMQIEDNRARDLTEVEPEPSDVEGEWLAVLERFKDRLTPAQFRVFLLRAAAEQAIAEAEAEQHTDSDGASAERHQP